MTSGRETEWDYSGRKERDGQKKKIGKAGKGIKERTYVHLKVTKLQRLQT